MTDKKTDVVSELTEVVSSGLFDALEIDERIAEDITIVMPHQRYRLYYRNDPVFRARVKLIVARLMQLECFDARGSVTQDQLG